MTTRTITDTTDIQAYLFGCARSSIFTLVSKKTGSRFTFRFRRVPNTSHRFFVDVLAGDDNEHDYRFVGTCNKRSRGRAFKYSIESNIVADDLRVIAIEFFINRIHYDRPLDPAKIEFWCSGRCSQCGRLLTVPESLARGMGPKCRAKAEGLL